ncbi:MAG: DUF937 domain-containing protein [Chromatiales bacterium]|jgi:hypothetical protein|nr:DUF937 domain-containing protein [Chromatiales bacterium]
MQANDFLSQSGGLQSMARELGLSETQTNQAAQALMPALLGGFRKQAQASPNGIEGLGGMLGRLGGGSLLDNVVSQQPTDISRGNNVLDHVFGSKDVSRAVAENASQRSGMSSLVMKRILPMLAMVVAGHMAKQGLDSVRRSQAQAAQTAQRGQTEQTIQATPSGQTGQREQVTQPTQTSQTEQITQSEQPVQTTVQTTQPVQTSGQTNQTTPTGQPAQTLGGMLGKLFGEHSNATNTTAQTHSGLASMLGMDSDHNPLDEIINFARNKLR